MHLFSATSNRVLNSEPLELLVLGGLFLVLSIVRRRNRRTADDAVATPRTARSAHSLSHAAPLAVHQGR